MQPAETTPPALPKIDPTDRLGAVVPASASKVLEGADLTNVIVLAHRRNTSGVEAPTVTIDSDTRPVPWLQFANRAPWVALIAAALLLHLGLVVAFMRDPAPIQSLALDSISVEIVLGGQTEAGVTQIPSPAESAPSQPAESPSEPQKAEPPTESTEEAKPELRPRLETQEAQREQQQPEEPKREEQKPEEPKTAAVEPEPAPAPTEPEPTAAVAAAEPTPQKAEPDQPKQAEPEQAKQAEPEKPKPVEEPVASQPPPPKEQPTEKSREKSKPTPPRVAASQSGVGVGSSREIRNWASRVSEQLARNKRYPADALALGIGGTASVTFTLDVTGRVTSVRLARSSGNRSLDRESQDLVRRASPFPPPPQGKGSITVPVNFNVRSER